MVWIFYGGFPGNGRRPRCIGATEEEGATRLPHAELCKILNVPKITAIVELPVSYERWICGVHAEKLRGCGFCPDCTAKRSWN